jgi:hypothetical protein
MLGAGSEQAWIQCLSIVFETLNMPDEKMSKYYHDPSNESISNREALNSSQYLIPLSSAAIRSRGKHTLPYVP